LAIRILLAFRNHAAIYRHILAAKVVFIVLGTTEKIEVPLPFKYTIPDAEGLA
jgi:predicted membrane chloride channel (bestrophin family)